MRDLKLLVMVLCLTLMLPALAVAKGRIMWMTTHWPPLMELSGKNNQVIGGQYGNQLKLLQQHLSKYDHVNMSMTWNRFWHFVKKGERKCNCMAYKNDERKEFAQFSIPISFILPNHIVMRKETIKQLGNPLSLSLIDMMLDVRFRGLLIKNRSYSFDVDRILARYEKESNIDREIIDEQTYIKMLAMKRMDYILEYPFVVNDTVKKNLPELEGVFGYVPITEIAPFYYVYVACPKNEWGKSVIKDINMALRKLRPTPEFKNEMSRMFTGEELEMVMKLYDGHLLKITD
ncbi:MAG: hypothetical protein MI892_03830 [Desulfobacterales bacterium]|nr:hypothetical protein [Desulfobacterales bacterium]